MTTELDLAPERLDIRTRQYSRALASFAVTAGGSPVSLTGYTVKLQVRKYAGDTSTLLDLSTATTGLSWVSASGGTFNLDISAATLGAVPAGTWTYDLLLVPGTSGTANARTYASGQFIVEEGVTR